MAAEQNYYCHRCRAYRGVTAPWPYWKRVRQLYFAIPVLALPALPIMLADVFVMTPMVMAYLFAVGPVLSTRRLAIKCKRCGAVIDPKAPRPVPAPDDEKAR